MIIEERETMSFDYNPILFVYTDGRIDEYEERIITLLKFKRTVFLCRPGHSDTE